MPLLIDMTYQDHWGMVLLGITHQVGGTFPDLADAPRRSLDALGTQGLNRIND
jgi:hypothetical protein